MDRKRPMPPNACQSEIPPVEAGCEGGVIETKESQNRGVKEVDLERILDDVPSSIIRMTDQLSTPDISRSHPQAGREGVVIAAITDTSLANKTVATTVVEWVSRRAG